MLASIDYLCLSSFKLTFSGSFHDEWFSIETWIFLYYVMKLQVLFISYLAFLWHCSGKARPGEAGGCCIVDARSGKILPSSLGLCCHTAGVGAPHSSWEGTGVPDPQSACTDTRWLGPKRVLCDCFPCGPLAQHGGGLVTAAGWKPWPSAKILLHHPRRKWVGPLIIAGWGSGGKV